MNTEKQKIYNKLFKSKKTDLKKVHLNRVDEIESELDWFYNIYGTASYYAYERFDELTKIFEEVREKFYEVDELAINSGVSGLKEEAGNILERVNTLESNVSELGLDVDEITFDTPNGVKTLNELKNELNNSLEVYADMIKEYREFVRYVGFLNENM